MPLSIQGNAVLSKMFGAYSRAYVENNPGVNMNQVERIFLYDILSGLVANSSFSFEAYSNELRETEELIEAIR